RGDDDVLDALGDLPAAGLPLERGRIGGGVGGHGRSPFVSACRTEAAQARTSTLTSASPSSSSQSAWASPWRRASRHVGLGSPSLRKASVVTSMLRPAARASSLAARRSGTSPRTRLR